MLVGDASDCDSLQIEVDKQLFSWWSKGWHGDVFTYLMESRGIDFRAALEILSIFANEQPSLPPAKAFKAFDARPKPPISVDLVDKFQQNLLHSDRAIEYLLNRGLGTQDLEPYRVGFDTNYNGTDIITIPVIEDKAVKTIRYRRIEDPTKGLVNGEGRKLAKYGYMFSGYGAHLYNSETLLRKPDTVYIVEGEFKTITCESFGLPSVGIMGASSMKTEWFSRFDDIRRVIVALDPDQSPFEMKWVNRLAAHHKNVRVLQLWGKIDDMLLDNKLDFIMRSVETARRVVPVEDQKPNGVAGFRRSGA